MKTLLRAIINKPAQFLGSLAGYHDLTDLHNEWIKLAWDQKEPVGIRAFRGSYKTSSVIIIGGIRYILLNPDKRIILIRKTQQGDASPTLRAMVNLIRSEKIWSIFQYLYPGIEIVEDTKTRFRLSTMPTGTKEANVMAFGIGDSITGTHGDVILTDDILNIKDRVSVAERNKTKQAFYELQNIADDGAKQIYNGTVWHEGDVWTDIAKVAKIYDYPASEYWDQLFEPESLEKRRESLPPTLFAINYELSFIHDDSLLFSRVRYSDETIDENSFRQGKVFAHVDGAYGGRDTTALTVKAGDLIFGKVWPDHVSKHVQEIGRICREYNVSMGYAETNADKGYLLNELKETGTPWRGYHEKTNKEIKISTVLQKHWDRLQFDRRTDDEYIQQVSEWSEDGRGSDDAPDSLASLLRQTEGGTIEMSDTARAVLFGG